MSVVSGGLACIGGALILARLLPAFSRQKTSIAGEAGARASRRHRFLSVSAAAPDHNQPALSTSARTPVSWSNPALASVVSRTRFVAAAVAAMIMS